jgi:hypothetical protein
MSGNRGDSNQIKVCNLSQQSRQALSKFMQSWGIRARERHNKQQQHSTFSSQEVHSRPQLRKRSRKIVNDENKGVKTVKYNGRIYHDIATVKESKEDNSFCQRTVWHITAKETVNFKRSKFFVAKSDIPKDMCVFLCNKRSCVGIQS